MINLYEIAEKVILLNPFWPSHKKLPYTALFSHNMTLEFTWFSQTIKKYFQWLQKKEEERNLFGKICIKLLYVEGINHGTVVTAQLFCTGKLLDTTITCMQKMFTNNLSPTEKLSRKSCNAKRKSWNSCFTWHGIVVTYYNNSVQNSYHGKVVIITE